MNHKMNVTFVCLYNSNVVAYFTWCADSIMVKHLEKNHKMELDKLSIDYKYLPALKLCRLGVDKNFKGNRIGHNLVELVIKNALALSERIGLRYVSVDADCKAKWLYDEYQFKLFPKENRKLIKYMRNPQPNQWVSMYKDIHKN